MTLARRLVLAALALGATCACQSARRPLVIDSDPPGAAVWINGEASGFATPCKLDLDRRRVKTVELELPGYRVEQRVLVSGSWRQAALWREMSLGTQTWRFPLFMPTKDILLPVRTDSGEMPNRIHARLVREPSE